MLLDAFGKILQGGGKKRLQKTTGQFEIRTWKEYREMRNCRVKIVGITITTKLQEKDKNPEHYIRL